MSLSTANAGRQASDSLPAAPAVGLIDQVEAARFLGLRPKTLAKDRCTREIGIPFIKIGRSARYRMSDLEKFVADRVVA